VKESIEILQTFVQTQINMMEYVESNIFGETSVIGLHIFYYFVCTDKYDLLHLYVCVFMHVCICMCMHGYGLTQKYALDNSTIL
jgi:ABC-type molybdate transport system permease subunit